MRFIKFYYKYPSENTFVFCLDHLLTADSKGRDTKIVLSNGREEVLPIDIEDFCAEVFSDIYLEKEYQIIDIEQKDRPIPPPLTALDLLG